MLATILVMALAQDGGSVPQTCGAVLRSTREVEGDVELYALQPGRDASRRRTVELKDGGFCAPLEPGQWLARASGVAFEEEDPLSSPSWSATSRFTVPATGALQLTVPREAKRTFVVKDSWGRAVMGKLAVFSAAEDLATLVWSVTLDAQGRAHAELPDGDIEVRLSHGMPQRVHVERRTLEPADVTVTLVVERARSVSFRAVGPDGAALDSVTVDGVPANCTSGLCWVETGPSVTSIVVADGRGADAVVQLPRKPADLTLPQVKLTANQERMLKVVGNSGVALDATLEVQPVTRPGRWRVGRGLVRLPSGEREVLVRPAARQGGAFRLTRLAVRNGIIELSLPTAGFLKLNAPQGLAELWVRPADPKLPPARIDVQRETTRGPLLSGRYTVGGWSRGQALAPTDVDVVPGAAALVTLTPGPTATLVLRNERHDAQHPTLVVVLPGSDGKLPEGLADVRAVSSAFGIGAQAGLATLSAVPGPVTIVALWQRQQQPLRAVSKQVVLTEGTNEVRLDDDLHQQDLGPLTDTLRELLAEPFVTTVDP